MSTNRFSITTRQGDEGRTRLFSGETVSKASARPEAYGTVDELVSLLGVARGHAAKEGTRATILWLQRQLFRLGAELATTPAHLDRLKERFDERCLAELDARRDALEARIALPRGFVVPGGAPGSAYLDLARAVSRRAERLAVALHDAGDLPNPVVLRWLNRLSDFLWLLARDEATEMTLVRED